VVLNLLQLTSTLTLASSNLHPLPSTSISLSGRLLPLLVEENDGHKQTDETKTRRLSLGHQHQHPRHNPCLLRAYFLTGEL